MEVSIPQEAMKPMAVAWHPHPITPAAGREMREHPWRAGQTVREALLAHGIDRHQPISILINDRVLTVEEWDTVCPSPGDIINVQAEMTGGGGGGGSNPLRIVLTIVVMIVAIYTQQWWLAEFGKDATVGAMLASTAVMMAGSALINAIVPFPKPNLTTDLGGKYSQASPTYSLTGGSNRARPYEAMPVVMGTHRFFPDHGARPYTEFRGDDQYLYQIFHLGLCPLSLSDWRIGTTPITDYQDVTFCWPDAQGRIAAFPGNVDTAGGAELTAAVGWVTRVTSPDTYRIGIDLEGVLYRANDKGGMDEVSVTLQIQYRLQGTSTWQAGNVQAPVYTADGYWSFGEDFGSISYVESPPGTWAVTYSGKGAPWEQYYYDGSTDPGAPHDTSDHWEWHGPRPYFGSWRYVKYKDMGGQAQPPRPYTIASVTDFVLTGNTQTPLRKSLYIDVPTGTYEVRILRATPDDSDARTQSRIQWSVLRSYQADSTDYTGQNRVGVIIKATQQLNGTMQQVSVMAKAVCNYWNGSSWVWGFSSNPSHRYSFFARGYRDDNGRLLFGCGLGDAQIDLDGLHAWGVFCDREGLTFDGVIDGGQSAEEVLSLIARCGFASTSRATGKLGVVWDERNQDPVAAFGMSNIIRGSFEVSYITEQLAEELIVTFINPAKDYAQDQVRVTVPGIASPQRTATVDLMGCCSEAMAAKYANYLAGQQKYRRRRIKWESDFEGFVCQRGDVTVLSHDLTQWGYSGRLVAVAGSVLTLDRAVPRSGATEYLMLRRPDGTMTTYTVAAGTGESDTLTLGSTPTLEEDRLPVDHVWFFSPLATPGKKIKLLSARPLSESRVEVIATDEDPQFYAAWDGSWEAAPISTVLKQVAPAISSLFVSEHLVPVAEGVQTSALLTWRNGSQVEHVAVRWRLDGGPWTTVPAVRGESVTLILPAVGLLEVEATPIGTIFPGVPVSATAQVYGPEKPQITHVSSAETLVVAAGAVVPKVSLAWTTDIATDRVDILWRYNGGAWNGPFRVTASYFEVILPDDGLFEAEITPYRYLYGDAAAYAKSVSKKVEPPADVAGLAIASVSGGTAILTCEPATDLDVLIGGSLWVRFSPLTAGATWGNAADLVPPVPGSATQVTVPSLTGTYLAKWVDSSGRPSNAAALVVSNVAAIVQTNAILGGEHAPGWAGPRTDLDLDAGTLILSSAALVDDLIDIDSVAVWDALTGTLKQIGTYRTAAYDMGAVYVARATALVQFSAFCPTDLIDARSALVDDWQDVDNALIEDVNAGVYVSTTNDDPGGSPTWSEWSPLMVASDLQARAVQFELRAATYRQDRSIRVESFGVSLDVPDRIESGADVVSGAGAATITYARPFFVSPSVGIAAQGMATGDYYEITGKGTSGFTITFRNSAGTAISRTFDWIAKGY